ncbi:hypothetical protein JCGZ_27027 [Jatropha curcas]|uniref:Uncharacterized protein n=1 Tax=Jatropha curcas TaxID=180498 RepID=A0A067LD36_JATCU|nr:hypothetical protein JCGZ_27027 [Jatropha curcas]
MYRCQRATSSSSFPPRLRPPEPIDLISSPSRHHRSCSDLPSPLSFDPGERSSRRKAEISLDHEIASSAQFFRRSQAMSQARSTSFPPLFLFYGFTLE